MITAAHRPSLDWFDKLPGDRLLAEISLWSADLGRIEPDLRRVEVGADIFHFDVADGHFAPALLFFPDLVARLREVTSKPFHVHLMVADAILLGQIAQFAEAGADLITIHAENGKVAEALSAIRGAGVKAGIALKLETPVAAASPWLDSIDMLTLLGTRLGVKGQSLAEQAPSRLGEARALIHGKEHVGRIVLAADGGIREATVPRLRAAGAETVVMGSLAFAAPDFTERIAWLRGLPGP